MPSPSDFISIPFATWVNLFVREWLVPNFRPFFRSMQWPITQVLNALSGFLNATPMLVFTVALALIAWRTAGRGVALFTLVALSFIDMIGLWPETMTTLAMVVTAVLFCVVIGIPLGVLAARSDIFRAILRPILDIMQTIPSFVYLVPIVMLFGVGMVPAVIATIIFALPPLVRLTDLGIRQVQGELVEAVEVFLAGAPLEQLQLPLDQRLPHRVFGVGVMNVPLRVRFAGYVVGGLHRYSWPLGHLVVALIRTRTRTVVESRCGGMSQCARSVL